MKGGDGEVGCRAAWSVGVEDEPPGTASGAGPSARGRIGAVLTGCAWMTVT